MVLVLKVKFPFICPIKYCFLNLSHQIPPHKIDFDLLSTTRPRPNQTGPETGVKHVYIVSKLENGKGKCITEASMK